MLQEQLESTWKRILLWLDEKSRSTKIPLICVKNPHDVPKSDDVSRLWIVSTNYISPVTLARHLEKRFLLVG